jgi:flagellar hook-length control protein FliK
MQKTLSSLIIQDTDADLDTDPTRASATAGSGDSSQADDSTNAATANSSAAAMNAQLSVGSNLSAQQTPTHTNSADIPSPVGSPAWADELSSKVTWMANQGIESASLRLSPEHLGPVEVHISVQDGSTRVVFGAAQADTRSALEQALPRLREMFASQGLTLADAGVSREPPRQPQSRASAVAAVSSLSPGSEESAAVSSVLPVRLGLLDTYA